MCLPGEQRDAVVGGYASQHADAGQLVCEKLSVVLLQLVDLFVLVRRDAVQRLEVEGRVGVYEGLEKVEVSGIYPNTPRE